jgi:3',5'-cyclic AMP phosphodiesterase CpdA
MDINSNSRDFTSHIGWMKNVVAEQGKNTKWQMLAFQHSIYSRGPHATDADVVDRRIVLPTAISDLGIDLVLQGHDHSAPAATSSTTATRPTLRKRRAPTLSRQAQAECCT